MEGIVYKAYSHRLHRDMEYKVIGKRGRICLAFPTHGGRYFDFENYGLAATMEQWIEKGKIQLVLVDAIDKETWIAYDREPRQRIELHQAWAEYVTHELLPALRERNNNSHKAMLIGCDLGATHAANFLFHRPDLFDTLIGLSGVYSCEPYFGTYTDDLVYSNSTSRFLLSVPMDHPWIRLYRKSNIVLCCGKGLWEATALQGTRELNTVLDRMQVKHWTDIWGDDVAHDWYWWKKQLPYFLGKMKI